MCMKCISSIYDLNKDMCFSCKWPGTIINITMIIIVLSNINLGVVL
jgi:hypothetical protein